MTLQHSAIRHAPKVAVYVAAAAVALVAAAVASQSTLVPPSADEPVLTVFRPVLQKADRLDTLAAAATASPPAPAAPAVASANVPIPIHPPAVRQLAVATPIPPKPMARPCSESCAPIRTAAAKPAKEQVASLAVEAPAQPVAELVADAGDPIPPMPVGPSADDHQPGLLARSGQVIGSVWGWSGHAVGGIVREVRSRTF